MSNTKFGKGKCAEGTFLVNRTQIADNSCRLAEIATRGHHFSFDKITRVTGEVRR